MKGTNSIKIETPFEGDDKVYYINGGRTSGKVNKLVDNMIKLINDLQQENQQLKELLNTILNFGFFKEECPLNLGFEKDTNEDKAQDVFNEDEYCENTCNNNFKKCWLKYFERLQEIERSDSNE